MTAKVHDPHVFKQYGFWYWKCECGETRGPFKLRRDADNSDSDHREASRDES